MTRNQHGHAATPFPYLHQYCHGCTSSNNISRYLWADRSAPIGNFPAPAVEYASATPNPKGNRMRRLLALLVSCVILTALIARAQVTPPEEKAFLDRNIGKLVKLDPTPIIGEPLDKVFAAKFYNVKVNIGGGRSEER